MRSWESGIFGMVAQDDWLDVGFTPVTRPNDPVDTLFGDVKTDNITAKWETIATEYQIPVMAQFHGFDTEAMTTFRVPVENRYVEKGLIKVKINQSERMRTLLRAGVQNDQMYDYIINDGVRLADQVITRTKVAKNELLATGQVTINENNLSLTVDYGVPAAQTEYEIDLSADADILSQIQTIVDAALASGVVLTGMITSKKNINKMRQNAKLQTVVNGNIGAGAMIRRTALEAYFEEEFGINQIITNDQTYGASGAIDMSTGLPSITTARYYPDNKITFFGANNGGKLGTGLWGDPPEVDDFEARVNASGRSPYVYITQWMEKDPHVLWTKASGLFIPVLYNPYSIYIATVDDGAEGATGATGATGAEGETGAEGATGA